MSYARVFVNRTLNLKKISHIGLDMDHTLVRYSPERTEKLTFDLIKVRLVEAFGYPPSVASLDFQYELSLRGLVIDRSLGNLLKVNRFGAIREVFHGPKRLNFSELKKVYRSTYIDLADSRYYSIDSIFSLSHAVLFALIVGLKKTDSEGRFPSYEAISNDILQAIDEVHRDGSLKGEILKKFDQYIFPDAQLINRLECFKNCGKSIFLVTNSDIDYARRLLELAINPYTKTYGSWEKLFDFVVVSANKPSFFYESNDLWSIQLKDGSRSRASRMEKGGIYEGGRAQDIVKSFGLESDQILYIGDHIYGDVLRLKKECGWRTGMVIDELEEELDSLKKLESVQKKIDTLMNRKIPLELKQADLLAINSIKNRKSSPGEELTKEKELQQVNEEIQALDKEIEECIQSISKVYRTPWGSLMRCGSEESYFANQVERYSCVYFPRLIDFFNHSPFTYFRPKKRNLPHEITHNYDVSPDA